MIGQQSRCLLAIESGVEVGVAGGGVGGRRGTEWLGMLLWNKALPCVPSTLRLSRQLMVLTYCGLGHA